MYAVGELFNDIHALGSLERSEDFLLGSLGPAELHIVKDAAFYEAAVLEHKGHRVHQLLLGHRAYIRAADENAAALHVEEPAHKARKRRLAAARGADERHCLPGPNVHRDALYDLRLAVVAEVYVLKLHRAVLRVLRLIAYEHRLRVQHRVYAAERVGDDHFVLAHVHDLRQRQRDDRRDDDVEQQVQQKFRRDAALRKEQPARDEKRKHAVYSRSVEHHGHAQLHRVGDDPLFIFIYRCLELLE